MTTVSHPSPQRRIADVRSHVLGDLHFVVIETEGGLSGIGQSACWAYPSAVHEVVLRFREVLLGKDPSDIEHHHHLLHRMGPFKGSILGSAVASVDIALWDLKARSFDVPLWSLLGGRYRNRVRLHLILHATTTDGLVAEARKAVADGFTAVKFFPLPPDYYDLALDRLVSDTLERVIAVREAIGPDVDMILELNRRLTPLQAVPTIEALARVRPLFVEDPIQIDSIQAQAEIARRVTVPIGNGERMHTIYEFRELLQHGGPQYVRPDLGSAGGFTAVRKIAAIAESYHASVVTHNYFGPVLTAASATLDVSIPNFVTQEYITRDEAPIHRALHTHWRRDGGYLVPPEAPGLGVDFEEARFDPKDYEGYMGGRVGNVAMRSDGSVSLAV